LLRDNMPEFTRCLAEKMLTYSLGRGIETFDRRTVRDIVQQTAQQDYKFQAMISAVIHSVAFQQRRGETVPKQITTKASQEIASK
jgi:hypothetical protein